MKERYKLAIDVGGTFTDVVLYNQQEGELQLTKTPSSPKDPSNGVIDGIKKILQKAQVEPHLIDYFVHGTTFATNAFLENKGSRVALLTTEGFRDVVEIGRQKRPSLYDLFQDKPSSIVERRFRYGIEERMAADGTVITPLNEQSVRQAVEEIKKARIQSIAVVYLHAYANPAHEQKTAELIKTWYPECDVSLSSQICPEFREYERTITTVVNAYLKPDTRNYFLNLIDKLQDHNVKSPYIMKSSGGVMTTDVASDKVIETLLSGPAGGVIGSAFLAKEMGIENIITFDMGGTSTDVALIPDQSPRITLESVLKRYPLKVPMIEMETVGAGGGSVGWVDEGGLLKVGPESAGANPGPACYGNGGKNVTTTDANLILGRIDPAYFLGGEMQLDREASRNAFDTIVSETGLKLVEAASGIIRIANHHMVEAVRLVTIRKGYDPKDFTLFAFGGASPLHATAIAKELGIPQVVIPKASSVLSAFGLLAADIRHDFAITRLTPLAEGALPTIREVYAELEARAKELLDQEGVPEENRCLLLRMDLRYKGQAFEIAIDLDTGDVGQLQIDELFNMYEKEYERQYGSTGTDEEVEIVNYRLSAIGMTSKIALEKQTLVSEQPDANAFKGPRDVFLLSESQYREIPVYYLNKLQPGNKVNGPAVIEGVDTTIMLETSERAQLDALGNLIITIGE